MKTIISKLISYAVLALTISASIWPEIPQLVNIAHVAAWLWVGVLAFGIVFGAILGALLAFIQTQGEGLKPDTLKALHKWKARSWARKFIGLLYVALMVAAMASAGWTVAAIFYAGLYALLTFVLYAVLEIFGKPATAG